MNLKDFVLENQKIIELVKDRVGGQHDVDMYYGTLDYATARFNTILLKLSQDRLLEETVKSDVEDCFKTIQDFYTYLQRYRFWPFHNVVNKICFNCCSYKSRNTNSI